MTAKKYDITSKLKVVYLTYISIVMWSTNIADYT